MSDNRCPICKDLVPNPDIVTTLADSIMRASIEAGIIASLTARNAELVRDMEHFDECVDKVAILEKRISVAVNVPGKYEGNYPEDVMQRVLTMPNADLDRFLADNPEYAIGESDETNLQK